jgi:hypothetical protein
LAQRFFNRIRKPPSVRFVRLIVEIIFVQNTRPRKQVDVGGYRKMYFPLSKLQYYLKSV